MEGVVVRPKLSFSRGFTRHDSTKSIPRFDQLLRRSSSRQLQRYTSGASVVSIAKSATTKGGSPRKRVTFKRDSKRGILTEVSPSRVQLRSKDHKKLWITDEESDATAEQVIRVIQSFRNREDYVSSFITAFTNCARATESQRDVRRLGKVIQSHTQKAARGLEIQILSVLDAYRSKHVQAVLETQKVVAGLVEPAMQQQIIAERSSLYSKPGRMFARALAYTDERAVRKRKK